MKCNFCGNAIKKQGVFNEDVCLDCENKEIMRALNTAEGKELH